MKRLVFSSIAVALGLQLVCVFVLAAQDAAKVGPTIYKCIFENERVRVCEIRFKPGESIPVHSHPDHFVYVSAPAKMRITPVGGQAVEADLKVGQVLWIPAEAHSAVNIGTTELRAVVVDLKEFGPTERAVLQLGREWGEAITKRDWATMERIMADEWTVIVPSGAVQTKAEAMADLRSGTLRFESMTPRDVQVRVYGDTAIVTGTSVDKGTYQGRDISGEYRFTDVFVNRGGRWQVVSTQVTRVVPMP